MFLDWIHAITDQEGYPIDPDYVVQLFGEDS